ncbi:integrase core domain-containing protein [Arthrobacter pascens]|uniref:integrase core domain-containing protein n=1 Tax=Arthrobacter pascens TaxID=1677 RepID=UPI00196AB028|nr:integrase core domain-containing protein [Arthrobacter pascens]MBN3496646.1 transposase [Arthrobacter pascens]
MKIERFNRTLAAEWGYAKPFAGNSELAAVLDPWLNYDNTQRIHAAIRATPTTRLSPT